MKDLVIYGAGYPDVVKIIHRINQHKNQWNIVGFVDDTPEKQGTDFVGFPILGSKTVIEYWQQKGCVFINNVFANMLDRRKVGAVLKGYQCQYATLVPPEVDTYLTDIGEGTMISEGAVLGALAHIGQHCGIRSHSLVNHNDRLGDYVFIGPGATLCGHVIIESGAYIGAGSVIKEHTTIGCNAIIGAGSVVVTDVEPGQIVKGVPAKQ